MIIIKIIIIIVYGVPNRDFYLTNLIKNISILLCRTVLTDRNSEQSEVRATGPRIEG